MAKQKKREKVSDSTRKGGIRRQLMAIMAAMIAIPLLVVVIVTYKRTSDSAFEKIQIQNDLQVELVRRSVMNDLNRNFSILSSVAACPLTQDYLKKQTGKEELQSYLKMVSSDEESEGMIIVADKDGQEVTADGDAADVSKEDFFQRAIKGEWVCTDIHIDEKTKKRLVYVAAPVTEGGRRGWRNPRSRSSGV